MNVKMPLLLYDTENNGSSAEFGKRVLCWNRRAVHGHPVPDQLPHAHVMSHRSTNLIGMMSPSGLKCKGALQN
jgi:hypothetical protein